MSLLLYRLTSHSWLTTRNSSYSSSSRHSHFSDDCTVLKPGRSFLSHHEIHTRQDVQQYRNPSLQEYLIWTLFSQEQCISMRLVTRYLQWPSCNWISFHSRFLFSNKNKITRDLVVVSWNQIFTTWYFICTGIIIRKYRKHLQAGSDKE